MVCVAAAMLGLLAAPAAAQEAMTDAEREAFRAEVRAYLMENPEVLIEAIGVLEERKSQAQSETDAELLASNIDELTNDGYSFVAGNPDGDITIVEFLDYRCGYCKKSHPEVAQLLDGDGNIRLIIKEYPILGEASVLASRFAIATKMVAGDEAYQNIHNTMMEFNGEITSESLTRMAEMLELDVAAIVGVMGSEEIDAILEANRLLGQRMAINGTPTFVIADDLVRGYVPLDQMQAIVAENRG